MAAQIYQELGIYRIPMVVKAPNRRAINPHILQRQPI
jgi:hypothetical protein